MVIECHGYLALGLRADRGLHQQGIVLIDSVHANAHHRREVHSVWDYEVGQHDSSWNRQCFPAPRPSRAALIFHEGDQRECRGVRPHRYNPIGVTFFHSLKEERLISAYLER